MNYHHMKRFLMGFLILDCVYVSRNLLLCVIFSSIILKYCCLLANHLIKYTFCLYDYFFFLFEIFCQIAKFLLGLNRYTITTKKHIHFKHNLVCIVFLKLVNLRILLFQKFFQGSLSDQWGVFGVPKNVEPFFFN